MDMQNMIIVDKEALFQLIEQSGEIKKEIEDLKILLSAEMREKFPPKMTLTQVAESLGKSYRTVMTYTGPGGGLAKYYDSQDQPYCKGDEVRQFKYGSNYT